MWLATGCSAYACGAEKETDAFAFDWILNALVQPDRQVANRTRWCRRRVDRSCIWGCSDESRTVLRATLRRRADARHCCDGAQHSQRHDDNGAVELNLHGAAHPGRIDVSSLPIAQVDRRWISASGRAPRRRWRQTARAACWSSFRNAANRRYSRSKSAMTLAAVPQPASSDVWARATTSCAT